MEFAGEANDRNRHGCARLGQQWQGSRDSCDAVGPLPVFDEDRADYAWVGGSVPGALVRTGWGRRTGFGAREAPTEPTMCRNREFPVIGSDGEGGARGAGGDEF